MKPWLMPPDKRCCWTCHHWHASYYQISFLCAKTRMDKPLKDALDEVATEHGCCHRFPPGGGQKPFPYTFGQCTCGEWQSRPCEDERPIEDLDFSVRVRNVCDRAGIKTLTDLCAMSERDLRGLKNLGNTSIKEIHQLLAAEGLRLKESK